MNFRSIVWFCSILLCLLFSSEDAFAQARPIPNENYYRSFTDFYQADYRSAGKDFTRGANTALKFGNQRYLDTICFWTMVGECHYHLGNYAEAIQMYEQSLDLYLAYQAQQWQARLQPSPVIQADNSIVQRVRISWGTPHRRAIIPRLPDSFGVLFGERNEALAEQTGVLVDNTEIRSINLNEIMRCTALALHRRHVIKGPTSKFDPFTAKLVNGLRGGAIADGTLLGAYNGVLLGIAQASADDWESAARTLNRSLQFNGGMDHPLTPVALMELANIGLETENFEVAGSLALEASFSAAAFYQYDLVEESLSFATKIYLLNNRGPYPPLENAIVWANREKARLMQASLTVRLAECWAEAGNPNNAAATIRQLNSVINNRNSLGNAVVGSRLKFVSALVSFENGELVNGLNQLSSALASFQTGSLWLYRLGLADSLTVNGNIGDRQADLLYGTLLRDPSSRDWKLDPFEAIAFLASNHVGPMERWFDIVVNRKDMERAIDIAELVRRHRFFSQLPLGGRLLSFRWVLQAPESALSINALSQRREFLIQNTQYQQLAERTEQLRTALLLLPIKPDDGSPVLKEQAKLIAELGDVSSLQESYLASLALRRQPIEMVFPPQFDLSEFRRDIAEDQLALVTLATSSGYHLFFVNSKSVKYIGLFRARDLQRELVGLLRELGLMEAVVDVESLQANEWKIAAKDLTKKLWGEIPADSWKEIRELVIVPDGQLWYLPFELLQVGEGELQQNLIDVVELRYSPTLFLAYRNQRTSRGLSRTAVVNGRFHPQGDIALNATAYNELVAEIPTTANFERSIRIPSNLLGSLLDQLVVWSDIQPTRNTSPLVMQPMQIDHGKIGTTLGDWLTLPWYGPESVVMPGFNSDAGASLKGKFNGTDLFLTTTALMGAGTRSILISRWRTGGANSLALSRNFVQRLPNTSGALALKESIAATRAMDLVYANEPRVRSKSRDPVLKAEHPIFWAGFMRMEIPITNSPAANPADIEPPADEAVKDAAPADAMDPKPAVDGKTPPAAEKVPEQPNKQPVEADKKKDGIEKSPAEADKISPTKTPTHSDGSK